MTALLFSMLGTRIELVQPCDRGILRYCEFPLELIPRNIKLIAPHPNSFLIPLPHILEHLQELIGCELLTIC